MIRQIVIVSAIVAALYVVLLPIPGDIEIPWKLKLITTGFNAWFAISPYVPSSFKDLLDSTTGAFVRSMNSDVQYTDTTFDGVPVRVYHDDQDNGSLNKRPALVFYHGGGWTAGSADMYHPMMAEFARHIKAVFVSVEYRLAPAHIFPAAIDDCTAATVSFLRQLQDFHVDPTRVAVMGDAAGGNLAAAVAQRLTYNHDYQTLPKIKLQVLIYPSLQAFDFQTPSYQQNGDYKSIILDRMTMAAFWAQYLQGDRSLTHVMAANRHTSLSAKTQPLIKQCLSHNLIPDTFKQTGYRDRPAVDDGDNAVYDDIKSVLLDPDFAPLMRADLRGLPEAYILTGEFDVLRDDGIMYAKRLEKAGVKVTWMHYKKGFHVMFEKETPVFNAPSSKVAIQDFYTYILASL